MDALWSQLPDDFKSLVFDKLCAFGNNAANAVAVRFALPWDSEKAAALLAKLQGLFDVQSAVAFLHPFGTRRPEVTRLLEPGARTLLMNTLCLVHSRSTSAQAPYDAIPRRTSVESRRHRCVLVRSAKAACEVSCSRRFSLCRCRFLQLRVPAGRRPELGGHHPGRAATAGGRVHAANPHRQNAAASCGRRGELARSRHHFSRRELDA